MTKVLKTACQKILQQSQKPVQQTSVQLSYISENLEIEKSKNDSILTSQFIKTSLDHFAKHSMLDVEQVSGYASRLPDFSKVS